MKRSLSFAQLRRIKLDEWTRAIGPSGYARGVSACLQNGRELIEESLLLFEAGHTSRAVVLAILALEEGDKLKRLLRVALFTDPQDVRREWAKFRDHKPKLSSSLSLLTHGSWSLTSDEVARRKPLTPGAEWIADLPRLARRLKVRCLYVTRLKDGSWTVPSSVVPRLIAPAIITGVLHFFSMSTTLVLGTDMVIGGQLEPEPGQARPDMSEGTPRAKRWLRWRLGSAGQRWGLRELARHQKWLNEAEARQARLSSRARATSHKSKKGK